MGRLKQLPLRIGVLPSRVAAPTTGKVGQRVKTQAGAGFYGTRLWREVLRPRCLKAAGYRCQWPDCGRLESDTSQLVADHIVPHLGDWALFADPANLQCLCKTCHDGPKQAQDRKLYGSAIDLMQGDDGVWR